MEAFPEDYVAHNLPLILLSGIGHDEEAFSEASERSRNLLQEGGFRIRTDTPPLTDTAADNLLRTFVAFDSTSNGFNNKSVYARGSPGAFKIKRVGRVGQTPLDCSISSGLKLILSELTRLTPCLLEKHHLHLMPLDSVLCPMMTALHWH